MVPDDTKQLYSLYKTEKQRSDIKWHDDCLYRPHNQGLDTGKYELVGVLTHQGRSADSGHYISWTHQTGEKWAQFDDDIVSEKTIQ